MRIRNAAPLFVFIACGGISTAVADCCSSVFDCAAAVVTDGLSCEVETIISTIKTLYTLTSNIMSDIDGQTQAAQAGARQMVADRINSAQSQSQQNAADLAQAKTQAALIYQEETEIRKIQGTSVNHASGMQSAAPATVSTAPPSSSGPNTRIATVNNGQNLTSAAQGTTSPSQRQLVQRQSTAAPVDSQNSNTPANTMQKSTVASLAQGVASVESQKAPHGTYADAFSRGVKAIAALNVTGITDLNQVNQSIATAQASEGPGVAAANTLAGAMKAPLNNIESELSSMLTNPLSAFDPTSAVDSIEDSVKANMSGNIQQMVDDISAGPVQVLDAAGPTFDDLSATAENAQAIAAAMDRLYKERGPRAADALYALLPKQEYAGLSTKATTSARFAVSYGQRVTSAKLKTNFTVARQKILTSVRPLNVAPLHAAVVQFKAQQAQAKAAQAPTMLAMYRANTTRQLDGYFAGKSPLAVATERDQLIAQARTKFAKDAKIQNGVISLINTEVQKSGAAMTAAVPAQRAPTSTGIGVTSGAGVTTAAPTAALTSPAAVMPSPTGAKTKTRAATGLLPPPSAPTSGFSATLPAVAPTQPKAASWGTTPAWTPPVAASVHAAAAAPAMTRTASAPPHVASTTATAPATPHVVTAIKPATALKSVQPAQRAAQQPASTQAAPTSMPTTH